MLDELLTAHRAEILELARKRNLAAAGTGPAAALMDRGLPVLYDRLASALRGENGGDERARELVRLGCTASQVVHGYESLGQAITQTAVVLGAPFGPHDVKALKLGLDASLADVIRGYREVEREPDDEHLGRVVHELRGALTAAIVAHSAILEGAAGRGGPTDRLLEESLNRMRDLLDRGFAKTRLKAEPEPDRRRLRVVDLLGEVEASAMAEANAKGITLTVDAVPTLETDADGQYLVSAVSNLVQNAIEFTKPGGRVDVRASLEGPSVVIEVEDRCGGLARGKAEHLLAPARGEAPGRGGLGFGLAVSRTAAALNGGALSVRNLPGKGCRFTLTLPAPAPAAPAEAPLFAAPAGRRGRAARRAGRPSGRGRARTRRKARA